jgi:serine/threonine-protein kinase
VICFSNRRRDLDTLIDLLSRADSTTVAHAVSSVESLEDARSCLTLASSAVAMPKDPAVQRQIQQLDQLASRAELNLTSGRYEESRRMATEAVDGARKVDHAPLLAKALLVEGRAQWQTGHMKEASDIFREAVTVAERAKDDAAKARAMAWNVMVSGVELNDYRSAEMYGELARAALERASAGNDATQGTLEHYLGMMESRRGHPQVALELLQKALHLREQYYGHLHGEVGATLIQIGINLRELERYDEALEQQQRAIKLIEGTYGAGHPFVAQALSEIGSVYLAKGDQDKAIATYEDVIKRLKASVGPQHPDVAIALNNIGVALLTPDTVPAPTIKQAIAHFEEALAIEKAILGPNAREIAETMQNIGLAQLRMGDVAALDSLERALAIYKEQSELPSDIGDLYFNLARAASLANKPADAKSFAVAAIKEYEEHDRPADAASVREWQAQLH